VPLSAKALEHFAPLCVGRAPGELLFRATKPRGSDESWQIRSVMHCVARVFRLAGITDRERLPGTHRFRATCLTRMLDAGVSVAVVSKLAGHSSAAITLLHYAGVSDEAARAAVERV
jgi:integrase